MWVKVGVRVSEVGAGGAGGTPRSRGKGRAGSTVALKSLRMEAPRPPAPHEEATPWDKVG